MCIVAYGCTLMRDELHLVYHFVLSVLLKVFSKVLHSNFFLEKGLFLMKILKDFRAKNSKIQNIRIELFSVCSWQMRNQDVGTISMSTGFSSEKGDEPIKRQFVT